MRVTTKLYLFLALTILIWGNSFVVVDIAIRDGSSPTLIALARFLIASSIFGAYILLKRPAGVERADLGLFMFLAFIGIGAYYVFQYYGIKYAGPSISAILVTLLCPIMIFALSYRRLGERVSGTQKLGLLVAAAGSYLVITDGSVEFLSGWETLVGGVFGVVCAAFWALYTVEGKKVVRKYDPFVATGYLSLLGTVMLVPFSLAEIELSGHISFPPSFFVAALYLGTLATVLGYGFWFKALTGLSPSATGATLYFEPVVTVVFAWLLLGRGIGWFSAVGGVIVAMGVLLVTRR